MEEVQQDHKNGIKNTQQALKVTALITHSQNTAPICIQQANLVNQDIQEVIDNATEKELEAELKEMTGLDPMEGTAINKREHLISHADPDDRTIFEEMDDLLKENRITHNTITEEIQLPTQGKKPHQEEEDSTASKKNPCLQNTTNWNNLTIPPWNKQNTEADIHEEDEKIQEIRSSLAKAKHNT